MDDPPTERASDIDSAAAVDDQAVRLVELASRLASAGSVADVVEAVVDDGREKLAADNLTIYLLDGTGDLLRLAGGTGMDSRLRTKFEMFPVDASLPAGEALRTGELVSYVTRAERNARYTQFDGYEGGAGTVLVAPMMAEDGTRVGVLSVGWEDELRSTRAAEALTMAVAELCGRTIVRARQHDVAQRALAGQQILAEASRLLDDPSDLHATLEAVAELTIPRIVDVCVVCLLDDQEDLRPVVATTDEPHRQAVIDQLIARQPVIQSPTLLDVVSTGMTSFAQTVDRRDDATIADDEAHLELLQALDVASGVAVPLTGPDRIFGLVLFLVVGDRAQLGIGTVEIAESLASRMATAIHNIESYASLDRRIGHLEHALQSRTVIEQAKGMLANRWDISPDEAFEHMRKAARSQRLRMHALSVDVINGRDNLSSPADPAGRSNGD